MEFRTNFTPLVCGYYTDWNRWDGSIGYGGVGWYRVINPLSKLGYETVGKFTIGGAENALEMAKKGEIWFMKPTDSTGINVVIGAAKEMTGSKLIIDLDDDPVNFNEKHPLYNELKKKSEEVIKVLKIADHIVVSTEPLKEVALKYNSKVSVIPNAIDPAIWKVKQPKKDDRIRIGWIASGSHMADLPIITPVMQEILDKYPNVDFILAGVIAEDLRDYDGRVTHKQGTATYDKFPQFLADLNLDIAVAPLIDSEFNRSKSNIKWLESAMLKIPMVVSDVYPYTYSVTHGKDGYIAKTTAQWIKYLSWLIESKEKREEIGENAYQKVTSEYLIDKQLPKYEALFEKVRNKDITVYTSIIGEYDQLNEKQNTDGANFVAFTDKESQTWQTRKPYNQFKDSTRNSRIQKIMPHLFLDTKYSIYLDGNIELLVEPQKLIDEFLKDKDVAVFTHIGRDCIYAEADACVQLGKETPQALAEQIKEYARREIKPHSGLCECGVIIRRHTEEVNRMNEKWWAEYCRFGKRDQLSFPIAFDLNKVCQIPNGVHDHPYFKYKSHKK